MNQPTPEMVDAATKALTDALETDVMERLPPRELAHAADLAGTVLTAALAADPLRTGVTVRVAPGVTLHGDTGAFTATADAPPAAVARLLRDLADDLDRQAER